MGLRAAVAMVTPISFFDAADALADRRAELAAAAAVEPVAFFWTLRGGRWTAEHHGVAYDSYRAQARGGSPSTFCVLHRMAMAATFAVARYTEEVCLQLTKLWIHRMFFVFFVV